MYSYDYYTGEPIVGSPPNDSSGLTEQEIVNNANLIYNTNPQQRIQQFQQYPYGYQNSGFGNYMNQPVYGNGFTGYAGNPYGYQQYYNNQYNPYGYNTGYGYNMNPYYTQQQQFRDYTYVVPGFNTGSKALLPSNAEEICERLQLEMEQEQEEAYIKRMSKQKEYYNSLGYSGNFNYYGMPYANQQYQDMNVSNKYRRMIDQMRQEAIDNRLELNKNLSRLAHNYLNDGIDDKGIDDIYSSHTVTISADQIQESYDNSLLYQMVEIDPSIPYKEADAKASEIYDKYFDKDTDMKTFFENIGQVVREEKLEEEAHRRKDLSQLGDSSAYKSFMRRKMQERLNIKNDNNTGFTIPQMRQPGENIPMGNQFPTLNESATLLDDGTLSITAPPWLNSKTVVIKNEKENEYNLNERKFVQSIYGSNNPLGGGSNG